jgi:multiple sugar transport system ATP-binding protein
MKDGHIMQVAEPKELYNNPANLFVAGFIGSPPMNFLRGTIQSEGGRCIFVEDNLTNPPITITLNEKLAKKAASLTGKPVILGLRPEHVRHTVDGSGATLLRIDVAEPMGAETLLYLTTGAHSLIARVDPNRRFEPNQDLSFAFDLEHAHLFDAASEQTL